MAEKDTDVPLTDAEVMALKPDPQPAAAAPPAANDKPADAKPSKSFGDGTQFQDVQTTPNGTKGVIYAPSKNGPPLDANGNLIKKTKQQQAEEDRKRGREVLDREAKQREALAEKTTAEAAAKKAEIDNIKLGDIVGITVGGSVKVPVAGEKGADLKTIGLAEEPGKGQLHAGGTLAVGKSGLSVTFKVQLDAEKLGKKIGHEEGGKKATEAQKTYDDVKKRYDEAKERVMKEAEEAATKGEPPSEINRRTMEALTKELQKAGKDLGEAAMKGPDGKPWTPPPRAVIE